MRREADRQLEECPWELPISCPCFHITPQPDIFSDTESQGELWPTLLWWLKLDLWLCLFFFFLVCWNWLGAASWLFVRPGHPFVCATQFLLWFSPHRELRNNLSDYKLAPLWSEIILPWGQAHGHTSALEVGMRVDRMDWRWTGKRLRVPS